MSLLNLDMVKKNSVFVYNNFITSKAYKKAFFAFRDFNMHLSKP